MFKEVNHLGLKHASRCCLLLSWPNSGVEAPVVYKTGSNSKTSSQASRGDVYLTEQRIP